MVVSVEAREEEGTQALRITTRFACGTISPSIRPDSKSARAVKKPVRVELDRRTSSSSAYSRRQFDRIPLLPEAYIHLAHPFDYGRYLPPNRLTLEENTSN